MIFEKKIRNGFRVIGGVTLIRDQLFCSVQEEFRAYIGLGHSTAEAEDILIDFFTHAEGDDYDRAICYLALANVEWQSGRLSQRAKQTALSILDAGTALTPWKEACNVPPDDRANIFDLLFSDFESGESGGLTSLFYNGVCYDENREIETKETEKYKVESLLKFALDVPEDQDIKIKKDFKYSQNIAQILFLDKSPQKKYEMRIEELRKYKEHILSPMPKLKKYPKPNLRYISNDFDPGDIAVFKLQEGEYKGYYFAFQFLGKREYKKFMARNDVGLWYENYGVFYNFFSKEMPDFATLEHCGIRTINITKNDDKYYFAYNVLFYYNLEELKSLLVIKYFNDNYYLLKEIEETKRYLAGLHCSYHFSLDHSSDEKIKRYLVDDPNFWDWDKKDV